MGYGTLKWATSALVGVFLIAPGRADCADLPRSQTGRVAFKPVGDEGKIPERYRLAAHEFDYELRLKQDLDTFAAYEVRFPSPVETRHVENNTVYAEFYLPKKPGPLPGVIVLDILAGDAKVTRLQSALLAQNGIAALFVQMPYYGERRPKGTRVRMLMPDVDHSLNSFRQAVLDVRRAAAWLESRPQIDAARLGIMGTSLGSFIGAVSAEMEPRFKRVALLLGGGGLIDAFYEHPQATTYRRVFETLGGSKDKLKAILAPVDPLTYAENLRDRKLLMIGARRDEVVPPRATEALWLAAGKPRLVWYDCTHVGAALYFVPALYEVLVHFGAP